MFPQVYGLNKHCRRLLYEYIVSHLGVAVMEKTIFMIFF
jgi:hypothetical protein